jgi:hypothetical protein
MHCAAVLVHVPIQQVECHVYNVNPIAANFTYVANAVVAEH